MASKPSSLSGSTYKNTNRYMANKKRKLERALKKNPNNTQIQEALKNISSYSRKAPKAAYWSHGMIAQAKILKEVHGVMDMNIFSNIEATSATARIQLGRGRKLKHPEGKVSFSIGARAHDAQGRPVWA